MTSDNVVNIVRGGLRTKPQSPGVYTEWTAPYLEQTDAVLLVESYVNEKVAEARKKLLDMIDEKLMTTVGGIDVPLIQTIIEIAEFNTR